MQLNIAAGLHSEMKRKYDEALWLETMSSELEGVTDAEAGMQAVSYTHLTLPTILLV